jgi:hypothetical protein
MKIRVPYQILAFKTRKPSVAAMRPDPGTMRTVLTRHLHWTQEERFSSQVFRIYK